MNVEKLLINIYLLMKVLFVLTIIGVLSLFVYNNCFNPDTINYTIENYTDYEIVSIDIDQGLTGHFCLGSGTISDTLFYNVYIVNKQDGSLSLKQYPSDNSKIFMDTESPYLRITKSYRTDNTSHKMIDLSNYKKYQPKYEFHIPKNSIIQNFDLGK